MRSVTTMTGVAFVVALGLMMTGCASSTPGADNASKVSCKTIVHDIASTKTLLTTAQASFKEVKGTPAEASVKADVATNQTKLNALNKRSAQCTTAGAATDTKMTDAERDAIIKALTVSTIPASAMCKTDDYGNVVYHINSLLATPPRWRPDAPSTPIVATDPTAARVELQAAICEDPNLGSGWLTFTATAFHDALLTATGVDINKLNPELMAYTDQSAITAKATTFVPLLNVKTPTSVQLAFAVKQNANWQQDAAIMNTLLERFTAIGIDSRQSLVNYHLTDRGKNVHVLPNIGVSNIEESLPADVYIEADKGQCGEYVAFGANRLDKRPELFKAKTCAPPPTTPPTTTSKLGCKINCGTTTVVHVCPPNLPSGTWPDCRYKDGGNSAPNGSDGNGLSHDPTPAAPGPTPSQLPAPPRANPVAPAPSPAPTLTPDPVPDPAPTTSAPAPSDPASGCAHAPGKTC